MSNVHPWKSLACAVVFVSTLVGLSVSNEAFAQRARSRKPPENVDRDAALEAALRKRTLKIQSKFCKDLDSIATWAAKQGLRREAILLTKKIIKIQPEYKGLSALKKRLKDSETEKDKEKAANARESLKNRLENANEKQGKELVKLSQACMKVGLFTKAFDMITHVIEISPDDKKARSILGYKLDRKTKAWITNWEYDKRKKHFLTEEGWFEKKHKRDFDKGLRPYKGKWIPKDRESQIRKRNALAPYTIQSEHFEVRTNLGREKAYLFAMKLESFYSEFFRVFIGYYDQVAGARLLFNRPETKQSHVVMLFPTRAKYLQHVLQEMGNDELLRESAGFYSSSDRKSRFFWSDNEEETYRTLYHEVAHQLFAETKSTSRGGSQGNNWVVEGIASYIETWKIVDGKWLPGYEVDRGRMQAARSILAANPGWTLESFARIGHDEFHKENRGANYALSCALAHFFMHYNDELYKEDFVRFVSAYYAGNVREDSLSDYIKIEGGGPVFTVLGEQFRAYMTDLQRPSYGEEDDDDPADEALGS